MKIKNMLFQPLTLHLRTDGSGLHLLPRECRDLPEEQISDEIRLAASRGIVSLISEAVEDSQEEPSEQLVEKQDESATPLAPDPQKNKKGDRRR